MTAPVTPNEQLAVRDLMTYYSYEASSVRKLTGGTAGFIFCADDQYLLKVYDDRLSVTERCLQDLPSQLAVLEYLQEHTPLRNRICVPVRTVQNKFLYTHENVTGVLFRYIPGNAIGYARDYTLEEISQVAALSKALHEIDPAPIARLCPRENFQPDFCERLRQLLAQQADCLPWYFREPILDARAMLVMKSIVCQETARHLKNRNLPFVLCHTDLHGGNLIADPQGRLHIIDWENLLLAPREADLFAFSKKKGFSLFQEPTDPLVLSYYHLRRDLEDIWEFLCSILNQEYTAEEYPVILGHITRILGQIREHQ